MTITVHEVQDGRDLSRFVDLPWQLFPQDKFPQWVPPLRMSVLDALDREKHPFYRDASRALFIAKQQGRVVGRIAAIENRAHNRFHDDRVGFFGFLECCNDQDVANTLFETAARWLRARNLTSMLGPVNPSTNYECGLLVAGFENRPTFMTAWNPPYYDTLCKTAGFRKAKDLLAMWFPIDEPGYAMPEFVEKLAVRAQEKSRVTFRDIVLKDLESEIAICWDIYNDAWERNWGFVPMSRAEFDHLARDIKPLLRTELAFIALADGVPAGFMLALPDYNVALANNRNGRLFPFGLLRLLQHKRKARTARIMALGVKSAFRSRSILAVFAHELLKRGRHFGGTGAEASWLLEDNLNIVKPMMDMGARERMRWRVYERPV